MPHHIAFVNFRVFIGAAQQRGVKQIWTISKVLTFFSREGFLVPGAIEMREMSEIVETLFEMEGVSNVSIKIWLRSKCNFFCHIIKPSCQSRLFDMVQLLSLTRRSLQRRQLPCLTKLIRTGMENSMSTSSSSRSLLLQYFSSFSSFSYFLFLSQ